MNNGWIKLHRRIWENPISEKPSYLAVWIYLLSHANHEDNYAIINNKKTLVKAGSFIGSLRKISFHFGISISTVKYIIDYFVSEHMIEHKPNTKFSLFEIKNWHEYQNIEHQIAHKKNTNKTQIKTNNNDKNVKNDKNIVSKDTSSKAVVAYGKPEINQVMDFLKQSCGGSLDGSTKENRRFANHLINKFKKDYPDKDSVNLVEQLITLGMRDNFHAKNITNFKYLYNHHQKIILSIKSQVNNNKVLNI